MARLIAVIFVTVAVGAFGSPFEEGDLLNGDVHYPADLSWLFDGNRVSTAKRDLSRSVCNTEECNKIARVLTESMNNSVDPCENFYEYACGNWEKNNPIPKDKAIWNLMYMVAEKVGNQILDILKEDPKPDDIVPLKLARKLFFSCMDLEGMDRRGLEPLVITLARGNGWPMIMAPEEWDETEAKWQKVDHYYGHLRGSFTFFTLTLHGDKNTSDLYASIKSSYSPMLSWLLVEDKKKQSEEDKKDSGSNESEPENSTESASTERIPTDDDSNENNEDSQNNDNDNETDNDDKRNKKENSVETAYEDAFTLRSKKVKNVTLEEKRAAFKMFVVNVTLAIAEARGFPVSEEMIDQDVEDLMDFIVKFRNVTNTEADKEDEDLLMSISEIQEWYDSLEHNSSTSKIKWLNTLSVPFNDADMEIDEDLMVHFPEKNYFERLAALLDETSEKTLVNYAHWKVISNVLDATTSAMRELLDNIRNFGREPEKLSDAEKYERRKERCLNRVNAENIVGYEYVKRHFNEDHIELARQIIKDIQNEVENQIMQSEWMDNNTRIHALNKAKNMTMVVGYPEWYKNTTAVNNYYKGVVVSPSFFENLLTQEKRSKWKILRFVNQKEENITERIEIDNPAEVNAFYAGMANAIFITAADLQGPLFDSSRPAMINYGIIGLIIGHEINHGFDDHHFKYDDKGNEALSIMADAYNRKAGCFVEQYDNLTETMELFNGTVDGYGNQTAGENIADSMGLSAVYHAYKNREKKNGRPEQTLPGFEDFSNDQLFFLSFANMWCEAIDLEKARRQYERDSHSPGKLRVLGPLSNSVDFANAYQCPIGSRMNPAKKCNIWI